MIYIPDESGYKCRNCLATFWVEIDLAQEELYDAPVYCPYCGDDDLLKPNEKDDEDEEYESLRVINKLGDLLG